MNDNDPADAKKDPSEYAQNPETTKNYETTLSFETKSIQQNDTLNSRQLEFLTAEEAEKMSERSKTEFEKIFYENQKNDDSG